MRYRNPGLRAALVVVLVSLLALGLPRSLAAFSGTAGSTGTFATGTLAAPTGFSASRPCLPASPALRSTTVQQSVGTATSMNVTTPAGTTTGDVIIAWMTASTTGAVNGPGWNNIGNRIMTNYTFVGWYTPLLSAPAASYTFSWASGKAVVVLMSYSGADLYNPYQAGTATTYGTGTTATSPTVTPVKNPGRVVLATAVAGNPTLSDPSTSVQRAVTVSPDTVANLYSWDVLWSSNSTTPGYTTTWTGSREWVMMAGYVQPSWTPAKDPTITLTWTPAAVPADGYYLSRNDGATFDIDGQATNSYADTTTSGSTTYSYTLISTGRAWFSTASVSCATMPVC